MIYLCKISHSRDSDIPIRIGTHENSYTKFNIFYGKTIRKPLAIGRFGSHRSGKVWIYSGDLLLRSTHQ